MKASIGVVGATGLAGSTVLRVLEERGFPVGTLRLWASHRSAGAAVTFRGESFTVADVATEPSFEKLDFVFLAAGAEVARRTAPLVVRAGGIAIDKSSAYRADPAVPLVVPEVNPHALRGHAGIVANPNCVAIPLTVALFPLHAACGLRGLTVATYQAASGAGRALVEELLAQERAEIAGATPTAAVYPHVLHGNVVPGGWSMTGPDSEEELKIAAEVRRVLQLPDVGVSVTAVRVPVVVGHAAAVWAEFENPVTLAAAQKILGDAPGVRVIDDPGGQEYPTSRAAAGGDDVLVGRLRVDNDGHRVALFLAADNLRKGAATNAVQIAELLLEKP